MPEESGTRQMCRTPDRSYDTTDTYWRRYLPFLAGQAAKPAPVQETWWPWDGALIQLDKYCANHPRGTVVLLHGAGGYGRILAPFAQWLVAADYDCISPATD